MNAKLLCALVVPILLAAVINFQNVRDERSAAPTIQSVETIVLSTISSQLDITDYVAKQDRPFIIKGTPAVRWPALSLWKDPKYIQEHLAQKGEIRNVGVHDKPKFMYFHEKPMANLTGRIY